MQHYHSHITVPAFHATKLHGWKETSILLQTDIEVSDLMYTKHYVIGKKNINLIDDIIRDSINAAKLINGIRVKIEQEDSLTLPVTSDNYVEVHALINDPSAMLPETWKRSRNPKSLGKFFYTRRFRSGAHSAIVEEVNQDLVYYALAELKIEQIILDTNPAHDSWWA